MFNFKKRIFLIIFLFCLTSVSKGENYLEKGIDLGNQGKYKEAEEILKKGLEENPFSFEINFALGIVYTNSGEHKKAIEKLETAINLDPGKQEPYYVLGMLYEAEGEYNKAINLWERYLIFFGDQNQKEIEARLERLKEYVNNKK